MEIYAKIYCISIFFPFFLVFKHNFIRCADFTSIATQQVMTSQMRSHIEYLIDLLYSCAHFIAKIDENLALMTVFTTI